MTDQTPKVQVESTIPLSGNLIKTIINCFCQRPIQGDDTWEHCSIGVAQDSVSATDSYSAIVLGESKGDGYVATQRKEALLESERAKLYGHPVRLEQIDRNVDAEGVCKPMPHVQAVIKKELAKMRPLASVDPVALVAIGKVAVAAGALTVELFQPESDPKMLGFRFEFPPDAEHVNLFTEWEGNITARGVFKAFSLRSVKIEEEADSEEGQESPAPEAPKRRGKKSKVEVTLEVVEGQHAETRNNVVLLPQAEELPDENAEVERGVFKLPPLNMLSYEVGDTPVNKSGDYQTQIMETLRAFNLPARMVGVQVGPTVTLYEIDTPAGTSVKKFASLSDDLAMQLSVKSVRIQAPIPGKKAVGIEIPNKISRTVRLRDICGRKSFLDTESPLQVALGEDIGGKPVFADLAKMPHLLIAGATNSGKSIGVASILTSLLMRNTPDEVRLVLIDPKQVELSLFDNIPHLMCPVITEVREVPGVLRALVREMDRRYELLKNVGQRNILGYNESHKKLDGEVGMPYIVLVVDELADLMMQIGAEAESLIVRLAQKARAVGIHLVVATQRPSADIVTGMIKANVPSRIAFAVASGVDSSVILDQRGAETLLGRGDMLFSPIEAGGKATRVQGAYVSEQEVASICRYWRDQKEPSYTIPVGDPPEEAEGDDGVDALLGEAMLFTTEKGQASTAMLQRRFSIGFQRASKLIDAMEAQGLIGPRDGPRPRQVIVGGAE